jgi:hypothetical protein
MGCCSAAPRRQAEAKRMVDPGFALARDTVKSARNDRAWDSNFEIALLLCPEKLSVPRRADGTSANPYGFVERYL